MLDKIKKNVLKIENESLISNNLNQLQNIELNEIQEANFTLLKQLAATLNHEINNPLTSIIGQAEISEIAYNKGMESKLKQSLQNIISEAKKIESITRKFQELNVLNTIAYHGDAKMLKI